MLNFILKKTFGSKNDRDLRRLAPLVDRITSLEPEMRKLTDADLAAQTPRFRERLDRGEPLDDLLPEAFAVAREASSRRESAPAHAYTMSTGSAGNVGASTAGILGIARRKMTRPSSTTPSGPMPGLANASSRCVCTLVTSSPA